MVPKLHSYMHFRTDFDDSVKKKQETHSESSTVWTVRCQRTLWVELADNLGESHFAILSGES